MYPFRIRILGFAAVGTLIVLTANIPTHADEIAQNLGPVGPHEPILTTVGSKRVLAFYVPNGHRCAVYAIMSERSDDEASSPVRFRASLRPHQVIHLDGSPNASLTLQCGDGAKTLAIVGANEFVAARAAK